MARRESVEAGVEALAIAAVVCFAAWVLKRWPAAVAIGCWQVERKRTGWLPEVAGVWQTIYDAPASRVSLLVDDEFSPQLCAHWWLMGRGLRHKVLIGEDKTARFVVWPRWPAGSEPQWGGPGHRLRARSQGAVLWEKAID